MAQADFPDIQEKIKSQGEIVRKLKADKADKDKVKTFLLFNKFMRFSCNVINRTFLFAIYLFLILSSSGFFSFSFLHKLLLTVSYDPFCHYQSC